MYLERQVTPRRANPAIRVILVLLARFIDSKPILTVVKPDTLMRWHRAGWRLFWRWKLRLGGRPRIPRDLRRLIVEMARANFTWGEERIADEITGEAVHPTSRFKAAHVRKEIVRPGASPLHLMGMCVCGQTAARRANQTE